MAPLAAMPMPAACTRPAPVSVEFWRDKVSPVAFGVLFNEATEPSPSSALNQEKRTGTFLCAACYLPHFDSRYKYDSGTGWPSFTQPISGHAAQMQVLGAGLNLGVHLLEQLAPVSSAVTIAGELIARGYSRSQENQTDRHAVGILRRAGYSKETLIDALSWVARSSAGSGGRISRDA